jgi:predicted Zn-dependent protease
VKLLLQTFIIFACVTLSSCQFLPTKKSKPTEVTVDPNIDEKINPKDQETSVIETIPLMNNAVLSLYNQAQEQYKNNEFEKALASLERAHEIQPNVSQVSQLLAEISLHKGSFKQAYYWSDMATKNGPAKGKSCEKSWRILALAAENLGYFAQQTQALESKENCIVKADNRF